MARQLAAARRAGAPRGHPRRVGGRERSSAIEPALRERILKRRSMLPGES